MKGTEPGIHLGFSTADRIRRRGISSGIVSIDKLLGGGLEMGLLHLFYGARSLNDDLLRFAVHAQLPEGKGGADSPTIVIDSANIIRIEKIRDHAFELELEPEDVMDKIYISRAFNSSQTYDLVMNQLESFFDRVHARLLIVAGLPDLYLSEGITGEGLQHLTHMATKLMTFTLQRGIATVISAPSFPRSPSRPAGGKALASCAQVHVFVEESKMYCKYTLSKHPQYPVRRTSRTKPVASGTTLPLSHFLGKGEEGEE
jgi:RecA/RadA recombinase